MSEQKLFFTAEENIGGTPRSFWPALVMTGEEIDREIARLSSSRGAPSGRRRSFIVHPQSSKTGRGLAPGIDVAINVLLPGERRFLYWKMPVRYRFVSEVPQPATWVVALCRSKHSTPGIFRR